VRRRVQVRQVGHVEKEVVCGESAAERAAVEEPTPLGASARGGGGRFVSLTAPGSHAPMLGTRYPAESDIIVDMLQYARISRSAGVCARAVERAARSATRGPSRGTAGAPRRGPLSICGMPSVTARETETLPHQGWCRLVAP
jgi:hypothetical protein